MFPQIAYSKSAPVKNGQAWRTLNFALENIIDIISDIVDNAKPECPGDLTGIVETICAIVTNIIVLISVTLAGILQLVRVSTFAIISKGKDGYW